MGHHMSIRDVDLGRAGIRCSSLSLGTAGIGNLFREVSDSDARDTLEGSRSAGVTYFDTAPHYGLGLAERRLGKFVNEADRDSLVLSTKVGRLIRDNPSSDGGMDDQGFMVSNRVHRVLDYSYDGVMTSLEESLERMGVDSVDIVFVHDPDDHEKEALEGAFPALEKLRSEGTIRSYGAGMNQSAMLARFVQETDLDVVMCAGRFSLLEQPALDDLLPLAVEREVSVVAAGVFNSGILAREEPSEGAHYNYAPAPPDVLARAQTLAQVCVYHGYSLPQAAAQFPYVHPAIDVVCLGARNGRQATRNAELFETEVPRSFYVELANQGLIAAEAVAY